MMPLPGRPSVWLIAAASLLVLNSQTSFAACSATSTTSPATVSFGTQASQTIPAGGISPGGSAVDANISVSCTAVVLTLSLLSTTSWLRYTAQSALNLSNGTDLIPYIIASNSTYTPAITSAGGSVGGPTGFQLLTLGVLTGGHVDIPIHVSTLPTTIWPSAGTYTATQTLVVDGVMCTGLGLPGVCLGSSPVNTNVTMNLSLIVSKSCEFISTPTLVNFGQVSFLENANTVQLNATVRCTKLEDYVFYFDNGNNSTAGVRYLKSPAGAKIQYDILQPNTSQLLNVSNPGSQIGTGLDEALAIPLKITASQSTPAAGIYTDSVRMVIEY